MTSNNTLAAKEQVAHHLTSTWLGDLPSALPSCFQSSREGLFVVEGETPTARDFEAAVSTMSAMVNMTIHLKSSFNFMLGDALRLSKQVLGEAEAQRIKEEFLLHNGRVEHTVDEVERVCEGFPCPEDRRGLEYTHLQLLLPKKNDCLKGEITEEEYQAWVDLARDGEKTILNGEVVATRPISCSKLRAKIQEASGKAPRVKAGFLDPTGDAAELKLARTVCESLKEIRDALPDRWTLIPPSVASAVSAWEAHVSEKIGNLS